MIPVRYLATHSGSGLPFVTPISQASVSRFCPLTTGLPVPTRESGVYFSFDVFDVDCAAASIRKPPLR